MHISDEIILDILEIGNQHDTCFYEWLGQDDPEVQDDVVSVRKILSTLIPTMMLSTQSLLATTPSRKLRKYSGRLQR